MAELLLEICQMCNYYWEVCAESVMLYYIEDVGN